jgi:hypothetical protein
VSKFTSVGRRQNPLFPVGLAAELQRTVAG